MEALLTFVKDNQILSGSGVTILFALGAFVTNYFISKNKKPIKEVDMPGEISKPKIAKSDFKILFIDDQIFKVVDILKKQGWSNTRRIKDIKSFEEPDVREANVFFVDIQGVGKLLGFIDEGLGLAGALKEKYPEKKVVIYSAENNGDRFHKALKKVDEHLSKNADPYEFQQIVENFYEKINGV